MTETNALGLPQGPLYLMTEIVRQRERQLTALLALSNWGCMNGVRCGSSTPSTVTCR